jgi:hypothetical protein
MRWLAALLLFGQAWAVELPTISRPDGGGLTYDLGATAPWMPLLWDRLAVTLPAGATQCRITATMRTALGISADATDLLSLRDGHRLTLNGNNLTVAGLSGSWSGARSYPDSVTVDLAAPVDRLGEAVTLLCRQLHYANLGGVRTLGPRRVGITLTCSGNQSGELSIDLAEATSDQPPKLRFDALAIPLGGAIDWRSLAWYDGRQTASQLSWRLQALPAICTATGIAAGSRRDQTAELAAMARSLDWFSAAQLQLQAGSMMGDGIGTVLVSDGGASASATFDVAVVPASGELEIIGDLPFAVQAMARVQLRASRPDVRFVACQAHPATGLTHTVPAPFAISIDSGAILVLFDRLTVGEEVAEGCAVFEAGGSIFRLPYRIAILPGIAN